MEKIELRQYDSNEKEEARLLCNYIARIPFHEQLMLLEQGDKDAWQIVGTVSMDGFWDGKTTDKDQEVSHILEENMEGPILVVLTCGGKNREDNYGFWLGGGIWQVYPAQELEEVLQTYE